MIRLRLVFTITLLLGGLFSPVSADAQEAAKVARIGYLTATAGPFYQDFLRGLRDLGYVEGGNVVIEYRSAEGKIEQLPALAAELVGLKVDVIVAAVTVAALAAKQVTRTIPIVFPAVSDPVETGLVAGFARPGGNVTGLSFFNPELLGKSLELLKRAAPRPSSRCPLAADRFRGATGKGLAEGCRSRGACARGTAPSRRGARARRLRWGLRGNDQGARGRSDGADKRHVPPRAQTPRGPGGEEPAARRVPK